MRSAEWPRPGWHLPALGGLVVLLAAGDVWLGLLIDERHRGFLASDVGLGVCFAIPGLVAMWLRPHTATGGWMLILGLTILVETPYGFVYPPDLPGAPLIAVVGEPTYWFQFAIAGRLLLGYPSGRLPGLRERRLVRLGYGLAATGSAAALLAFARGGPTGRAYVTVTVVLMVAWILLAVPAATLVVGRLVRARPRRRRVEAFPVATAALAIGVFAVAFGVFVTYGYATDEVTTAVLYAVMAWTIVAAIPLAYFVGLLRERLALAAVGHLVRRLEHVGAQRVEAALGEALRDPALRVAFPTDGGLLDVTGQRIRVADGLAQTPLGEPPVAVLVHDPCLTEEPLLPAAANAARLALDNARLYAEVQAQLIEIRASRQRLVAAVDRQRRRLERDLHDGAQQRLLGIGYILAVLRSGLSRPADRELVAEIDARLRRTIAELRGVAQLLRPPVLTDQGLGPGLAWLARRAPMSVGVDVRLTERPDPVVELTAYHVVQEALRSIAERDPGAEVSVHATRQAGQLLVEVSAPGGRPALTAAAADVALCDQVGAVGGRLVVTARPDRQLLRAELPCGS
ncbi:sensor histidine kinase [Actinoplanes aureus]|uniref:histidine kinase n=1 Tax=Actinoplanes aureus TaxID=2792083 RepID=A0A931C4L0_9ACTN|nr:histidine kinase [Actinoplanes aureus]MBG0561287.1 histidine kinase [Actinoplanes aureus]